MNQSFKHYLLTVTKSKDCQELEVIQSLWSGYGKISRYQLQDSHLDTVVIKHIALGKSNSHPRGWNTDVSHQRKVKSYEIETAWYGDWSTQCNTKCRVPHCFGSYSEGSNQWIILEDLNSDFPLRKYNLNLSEVKVCLKWLANFHITFLSQKPVGLWDVGTYWHLATRLDEYELIENQELKAKAHRIDSLLNQCKYQTLVHGDAKLANFCFSQNGEVVAAVDFQYVGGGCGIKDVAYFLGSCLSSDECETNESELLDYYFSELKIAFDSSTHNDDFSLLESEWRDMYPIACTDFTRFMLGWMPTHQKINGYNLKLMTSVLDRIE